MSGKRDPEEFKIEAVKQVVDLDRSGKTEVFENVSRSTP